MRARAVAMKSVCGMMLSALLAVTPGALRAQAESKIRRPYPQEVVVESNAIVVALPQNAAKWRAPFDGRPGFFSWRIDANNAPGFSVVLAADSMMRVSNLAQVVAGSTLRKCQDPRSLSARSCTLPLADSVGVRDNTVLMILRDPATLAYFRETRPATVRVTTLDPHGRFRLERFRVRYRDIVGR